MRVDPSIVRIIVEQDCDAASSSQEELRQKAKKEALVPNQASSRAHHQKTMTASVANTMKFLGGPTQLHIDRSNAGKKRKSASQSLIFGFPCHTLIFIPIFENFFDHVTLQFTCIFWLQAARFFQAQSCLNYNLEAAIITVKPWRVTLRYMPDEAEQLPAAGHTAKVQAENSKAAIGSTQTTDQHDRHDRPHIEKSVYKGPVYNGLEPGVDSSELKATPRSVTCQKKLWSSNLRLKGFILFIVLALLLYQVLTKE